MCVYVVYSFADYARSIWIDYSDFYLIITTKKVRERLSLLFSFILFQVKVYDIDVFIYEQQKKTFITKEIINFMFFYISIKK